MADLYLSLSIMILLCGLAAMVGARIASQTLPATQRKGQLLACGLMFLYLCCLWDRPVLTRWIPWSSVIVLGNWLPLIACFLTGMYCRTSAVAVSRRCVLAMAGFMLSGYSLICPVLGTPPECFFYSRGQIFQIQTREDTCSAASAACLLRLHGIYSSEGEMARLCLTRSGTHWMGVYRGLKLKTAGTEWDVVVEEFDPHEVPDVDHFHPGVLSMAFASRSGAQVLASGLSNSSGHSVVLLEREADGHIQVFDPSPEFGFERWGRSFQSDIRSAVLLRLIPRDSRAWSREQLRQRIPRRTNRTLQERIRDSAAAVAVRQPHILIPRHKLVDSSDVSLLKL